MCRNDRQSRQAEEAQVAGPEGSASGDTQRVIRGRLHRSLTTGTPEERDVWLDAWAWHIVNMDAEITRLRAQLGEK